MRLIKDNDYILKYYGSYYSRKCLEIDHDKRPNASELIKHPFITKLAQGSQYLAKLIKDIIKLVEQYRMEEEKRKKMIIIRKKKMIMIMRMKMMMITVIIMIMIMIMIMRIILKMILKMKKILIQIVITIIIKIKKNQVF